MTLDLNYFNVAPKLGIEVDIRIDLEKSDIGPKTRGVFSHRDPFGKDTPLSVHHILILLEKDTSV